MSLETATGSKKPRHVVPMYLVGLGLVALVLSFNGYAASEPKGATSKPSGEGETTIDIKISGIPKTSADGAAYVLTDPDSKEQIEVLKSDTVLSGNVLKIKKGAMLRRIVMKDGTTVDFTKMKKAAAIVPRADTEPPPPPPDLRTSCVPVPSPIPVPVGAVVCCANGRVIHACTGVSGCDRGNDDACK